MHRYIALLRAINVGGHTVKMDQLRALFEGLELAHVSTFIASGNVIFESPRADVRALEQAIEAHLKHALGYAVSTFLRTPAELAAVAAWDPFPDPAEKAAIQALSIGFFRDEPTEDARRKLMALRGPIDNFCLHGREVYWSCSTPRVSDSKVSGATLEKALGMPLTVRNVTTVQKLAAKYPAKG